MILWLCKESSSDGRGRLMDKGFSVSGRESVALTP